MSDDLIVGLFFGGGFGVLTTYLFLATSDLGSKMLNVFESSTWRLWSISMVATVASVVGLYSFFGFKEPMEGWARTLFVVSTCVFLGFAMIWSYSISRLAFGGEIYLEKIALAAVALATVGILIATIDQTENILVLIAAAIIVFHHVVWDFLIWGSNATKQTMKIKSTR
jgi:hypothetical protein